jgi:hypothetical protein
MGGILERIPRIKNIVERFGPCPSKLVAAPGGPHFLVDNFFLVDNNLLKIAFHQRE